MPTVSVDGQRNMNNNGKKQKKTKSVVTVTQQVSPVMSHTLYSYRSVEATCGGMCILSSFVMGVCLRDVATDCTMLSSGRILLRPDTMT